MRRDRGGARGWKTAHRPKKGAFAAFRAAKGGRIQNSGVRMQKVRRGTGVLRHEPRASAWGAAERRMEGACGPGGGRGKLPGLQLSGKGQA